MNLFEYDARIESAFDEETGEILTDVIESLELERDAKIENLAMWVKELTAEAEAIKTEKLRLAERQRIAEKKAESIRKYLSDYLDGRKFKSAKTAISFRKSEVVVVDNIDDIPVRCLVFKDPEVDKKELKLLIKLGEPVEGAHIEEHQNIQIK